MAGRKKGEAVQLQIEVNTEEDWKKMLTKTGLIVVDVYSEWCGPCVGMVGALKKLKLELGGDILHFAMAKSDAIEDLSRFRNKSEPTWMFIAGGQMVNLMFGANAPRLTKLIFQELAKETKVLNNEAHRKSVPFHELTAEEKAREVEELNRKRALKAAEEEAAAKAMKEKKRKELEKKRLENALSPFYMVLVDADLVGGPFRPEEVDEGENGAKERPPDSELIPSFIRHALGERLMESRFITPDPIQAANWFFDRASQEAVGAAGEITDPLELLFQQQEAKAEEKSKLDGDEDEGMGLEEIQEFMEKPCVALLLRPPPVKEEKEENEEAEEGEVSEAGPEAAKEDDAHANEEEGIKIDEPTVEEPLQMLWGALEAFANKRSQRSGASINEREEPTENLLELQPSAESAIAAALLAAPYAVQPPGAWVPLQMNLRTNVIRILFSEFLSKLEDSLGPLEMPTSPTSSNIIRTKPSVRVAFLDLNTKLTLEQRNSSRIILQQRKLKLTELQRLVSHVDITPWMDKCEEMQIILVFVGKLREKSEGERGKGKEGSEENVEYEEEIDKEGEELLEGLSKLKFDYMSADFKLGMKDMQTLFPQVYEEVYVHVPAQTEEKIDDSKSEVIESS